MTITNLVLGIDPGISGAIAVIDACDERVIELINMPTEKAKTGRSQVDANALSAFVGAVIQRCAPCRAIVVVENVWPMPRDGSKQAFNLGDAKGVIRGVLSGHLVRSEFVAPITWKKHFHMLGTEKDYSRTLAKRRFPSVDLKFKKDHNKADALLLAAFGIEKYFDYLKSA